MSKGKIVGIVAAVILIIGILMVGNTVGWFVGNAVDTAKQEFSPQELLRKYEWFKDASAMLDKKLADVKVYEQRLTNLKEAYTSDGVTAPRNQWSRSDTDQWNVWQSEVAGVKASYNTLAAEYNAQMAKINWAFTNVGGLPKGAENPLPREYKPYTE